MPSELLSSITGGSGGAFPFPAIPTPLTNDGYQSATANRIPHNGTLVDNIKIPSAFNITGTGDFDGYLGNTLVWSVGADDLNAACDGFLGIQSCFYDSVNDRLYVLGIDTATTPYTYYLAYITLETGAVTNIGNAQFSTDPAGATISSGPSINRTAIDIGNFTIISSDRTIVINESTGAEISNVAGGAGATPGSYATADGTIYLYRVFYNSTESCGAVNLTKDGQFLSIPAPQPLVSNALVGTTINVLPWGDKVKLLADTTTTNAGILRTFNRSQFDAWLQEVAKFGGVS